MAISDNVPAPPGSPLYMITTRFWEEVVEATELLDYAVSSGYKAEDGRSASAEIITAIKTMHDTMQETGAGKLPPTEKRVSFEAAYFELSAIMAPITALTLRDTSEDRRYHITSFIARGPVPVSTVWNRKMTLWTIFFIMIAILQNVLEVAWGPTPDYASGDFLNKLRDYIQIVLHILLPFAYGGIGACTYLLKSLHYFIYSRSFDRKREAEYYNRILLGIIGGGTITLLVNQVTTDSGETISLSASALGFLAGYNTDFLFSAIERIASALLPKVGLDSVRRQTPPAQRPHLALNDVSLNDLLQRYAAADTADEKAMISALIDRIRERL